MKRKRERYGIPRRFRFGSKVSFLIPKNKIKIEEKKKKRNVNKCYPFLTNLVFSSKNIFFYEIYLFMFLVFICK